MDTISTLTKYAAGTNLCAMRVIDKINSVRTAKKQELIEKDITSFTEKYGAERAGRLAPAKIDNPNFAEILPFAACSDIVSDALPTARLSTFSGGGKYATYAKVSQE